MSHTRNIIKAPPNIDIHISLGSKNLIPINKTIPVFMAILIHFCKAAHLLHSLT